jgi:hypothetical protein
MLTETIVETARKQQTDKLLEAVALAARTAQGLPSMRNEPSRLAAVDTLVHLIASCCKDVDDKFDYGEFVRLCGVKL